MAKEHSGAVAAARRKQPPWLWIGVAAVVVVLLAAAVLAGGGSGGKSKSTQTAAGLEQTRPVTVIGTPLPKLAEGGDPAVGQEIPELKGQSFDGTPIDIRNDGRAKLILFVAHWCPHCQREVPLLTNYLKSHPLPSGVDLYTVATATSPNQPNYPPSAWLAKVGWKAPVLADSSDTKAAEAFGLPAYPYFVAVDGAGKVVARSTGEITTDQFAALAARALGNR